MSEKEEPRQWGVSDGKYRPVGITAGQIKAGFYEFWDSDYGLILRPANVVTDELIELPDPTCAEVLAGIEKFWAMEERYREHGLLYKRSVGLYGPPGGGKTAKLMQLARRIIAKDGLVILFNDETNEGLEMLRKIEPKRRVICIMEDLDEIIRGWERRVLSLLDGEAQVDGIVFMATTNYYDKLPVTLVNRPSRFDEWIEVKMPSAESRAVYLAKVAPQLTLDESARWIKDTEGFSIAHLKELAAAVLCLEHPYEQVLARLKKMLGAVESE